MRRGSGGPGRRRIGAVLLLLGLIATSAVIGPAAPVAGQATPTADAPPPRPIPAPLEVALTDAGFDPQLMVAVAGQSVVITNMTGAPRAVVADDGLFDSGPIPPGGAFTVALPDARLVPVTSPGEPGDPADPALTGVLAIGRLEVDGPPDAPVAGHLPTIESPPEDPATFGPDPVWGIVASRTTLILGFTSRATVADANRLLAAIDGTITGRAGSTGILRVSIPDRPDGSFADLQDALSLLRADPAVAYAAMNTLTGDTSLPVGAAPPDLTAEGFVFRPYAPNGGEPMGAYGLTQARFPQAWNLLDAIKRRDAPVAVAVVDDGVRVDHPDLADRPNQRPHVRTVSTCTGPWCFTSGPASHGTSVAGLIGGTTVGGSPVARIIGVEGMPRVTVDGVTGASLVDDAAQLAFLGDQKVPGGLTEDLRVINRSTVDVTFVTDPNAPSSQTRWAETFKHRLCGPGTTDDARSPTQPCTPNNEDGYAVEIGQMGLVHVELARHLSAKGIVVVQSGGNFSDIVSGQGSFCVPFNSTPCTFERIRADAISGFGWASRHWLDVPSTNNIILVGAVEADLARAPYSGVETDVSAGSTGVVSLRNDGLYRRFSGTSAATPFVSALVALLAAQEPSLTPHELRHLVIEHAVEDTTDDAAPRIDAYASLTGTATGMIDALDVNDPSADGNRRVIRGRARSGVPDRADDRLGDVVGGEQLRTSGDGAFDMRDLRRHRDAWLAGCLVERTFGCPAPAAIALDGDPFGPKRDLNLDGCVVGCPYPETLFPRFDPAGTGGLDRERRGRIGVDDSGRPSDAGLEVPLLAPLTLMWGDARPGSTADTEGWSDRSVASLWTSGDVEVHADDVFARGATEATVAVEYSRDGTTWTAAPTQKVTAGSRDGLMRVVTVPIPPEVSAGVKVRARVIATVAGKPIRSLLAKGTVRIGGDIRLDPCVPAVTLSSSPPVLSTRGRGRLSFKVDACGQRVTSASNPAGRAAATAADEPVVEDDDPDGSATGLEVDFSAQGSGADPADPEITREDTVTDEAGVATADVDAGEEEGDATFEATATFEDGATITASVDTPVMTGARLVYRWEQTVTDWERRVTTTSGTQERWAPAPDDLPVTVSRQGEIALDRPDQVTERYGDVGFTYAVSYDGQPPGGTGTHGLFPYFVDRDLTHDLARPIEVERSDTSVTIGGLDHVADVEVPYDCGDIPFCVGQRDTRAINLDWTHLTIGPRRFVRDGLGRWGGDGTALQHAPMIDADLTFTRDAEGDWQTRTFCGEGDFTFPRFRLRSDIAATSGGGHYETRFAATIVDGDGTPVLELPSCDAPPPPRADFTSDPAPGRAGVPTRFTDRSVAAAGVTTYAWDFGDGQTSSAQSPTHRFGSPGGYTVRLTITDAKGRTSTTTRHVEVNPEPPTASLDDATVAQGSAVVLHGRIYSPGELDQRSLRVELTSSAAGFPAQRQRRMPAGPIDITLPALAVGTYPVTLTVTDMAGQTAKATATIVVQAATPPPPTDPPPVVEPPAPECATGTTVTAEAHELFEGIDAVRQDAGLLEVVASPRLADAALRHAVDMAAHPDVVHTGSDGSTVAERALAAGYPEGVIVDQVVLRGPADAEDALVTWRTQAATEGRLLDARWVAAGAARVQAGSTWAWVLVLGAVVDCAGIGEGLRATPPTPSAGGAHGAGRHPSPRRAAVTAAPTSVDRARTTTAAATLPTAAVPAFVIDRRAATTGDDVRIWNRTHRSGALVAGSLTAGDGRPARSIDASATALVRWPAAGTWVPSIGAAAEDDGVRAALALVVSGPIVAPAVAYTGPDGGGQGAAVRLSARVTAAVGGAVLPGWPVTFALGSASATATTGDDGVATAPLTIPSALPGGAQTLTVTAAPVGAAPGATVAVAFDVTANQVPDADTGGPYDLLVDQPLALDGTGSTDAEDDVPALAWDLGADGDAPERTGVEPLPVGFAEAGTELCGGSCAVGVAYPVELIARDSRGAVTVERTTVTYRRDFFLTIGPATAVVNPGGSATYQVGIVTTSGFAQPVDLAISGLPSGVTATFSQTQATPGTTVYLTLRAAQSVSEGQASFTVTGTSGNLVRQTGSEVDLELGLVPVCFASAAGRVTDRETGLPVVGATILTTNAVTDADGRWRIDGFNLGGSSYARRQLTFSKPGYNANVRTVDLVCDRTTTLDATMLAVRKGSAAGRVTVGVRSPDALPFARGPVDSTDTPIPGALVYTNGADSVLASDATDGTGAYAIDRTIALGPENAPHTGTLTAVATGYWPASAPYTVGPGAPVTPDFNLVKGCTGGAVVRVLDEGTGDPVPGVLVATNTFVAYEGAPRSVAGVSDAEGFVTLDGISTGVNGAIQQVVVTAFPNGPDIEPAPGTTLLVTDCGSVDTGNVYVSRIVRNRGDLEVTVKDDATGLPLAGALVLVSGTSGEAPRTDASGIVRLEGIEVGQGTVTSRTVEVRVVREGYYQRVTGVLVRAGQTATVELRLPRPAVETVTGRLTDLATGQPLVGFAVATAGDAAVTDQDGRYTLDGDFVGDGQATGTIRVNVGDQKGYWGTETGVDVPLTQGGSSVRDIGLLRECATATLRGRVVNAVTRAPIEGASINASGWGATTAADGTFTVTGIKPGRNRPMEIPVSARKVGFVDAVKWVTVFCGANLVLDFGGETGTGSITGRVTDARDGSPVVGAFVGSGFGAATTTGSDGRYTLPGAPLGPEGAPRPWTVTVAPPTGSPLGGAEGTATVSSAGPTTLDLRLDVPSLPPAPDAIDDDVSVAAGEDLVVAAPGVLGNDTGTGLTVTSSTQPDHGSVTVGATGGFTYAPDEGFLGTDTFTYTVTDAHQRTDTATVAVEVEGPPPPDAADDAYTVDTEDTLVVEDPAAGLLANDSDDVTVQAHHDPDHGAVTIDDDGTFTYDPDDGFVGTDSFTYTVVDRFDRTATATVRITVTEVVLPPAPVAVEDTGATDAGVALVVAAPGVLANDTGAGLEVASSTPPGHGSVTVAADGSYTYTPTAGYDGPDAFTYTVIDDHDRTATATVAITVRPPSLPDPPTAGDDAYETPFDTTLVVPAPGVLADDTGTGIAVSASTDPSHGSVVVAADGSVTYTPEDGSSGTDAFSYTITDAHGRTAEATVTVVVDEPPPAVRVAIGDRVTRDEDGDGIQDPTEPGAAGVTVQLLGPTGAVLATTQTATDGRYTFDDLAVGDYAVRVTAPAGAGFAPTGVGADRRLDSDVGVDGVTPTIRLEPGVDPRLVPVVPSDGPLVASLIDRSVDAGLVALPAGLAVTATVRVAGSSDPLAAVAQGPWGSAFAWHVEVANTGAVPLTEVAVTAPELAGCARVIGELAVGASTAYDCTGTTTPTRDVVHEVAVAGLGPDATEPVTASTTARVELTYAVGDRVWEDLDHDGLQDDGEPGVGGVDIAVLGAGGTVLGTSTSAADGTYRVDGLRPGSVGVRFTRPGAYRWTVAGAGDDRTVDSDVDGGAATAATTGPIAIVDGQAPAVTDVDLGLWRPATVEGVVYADADHDGVRDPGEVGIPDVPVALLGVDDGEVATTTTGADGRYRFIDLVPGTYRVRFTVPEGFAVAGTARAALVTVISDPIAVAAGQLVRGVDLAMRPDVEPPEEPPEEPPVDPPTEPPTQPPVDPPTAPPPPSTPGPPTRTPDPGRIGGLARTGQDVGRPTAVGLLLLGAGAALVLLTRRRRLTTSGSSRHRPSGSGR